MDLKRDKTHKGNGNRFQSEGKHVEIEFFFNCQDQRLASMADFYCDDYGVMTDFDEPPHYTVSSEHLKNAPSTAAAVTQMLNIKTLVDGADWIIAGKGPRYRLVSFTVDSGPIEHIEPNFEATFENPFDSEICEVQRNKPNIDCLKLDYQKILFVSRYDETLRDFLFFVGVNGNSWVSMYAVTEFARRAWGWDEEKIRSAPTDSNDQTNWYRRFTATANSHAILGPLGRHGPSSNTPPNRTISHSEAWSKINALAQKLVDERIATFVSQL